MGWRIWQRRSLAILVLAATAFGVVRAFRVGVIDPIVVAVENRGCTDFDSFFFGAKIVRRDGRSYYDYQALTAVSGREANRPEIPITTAPVFSAVPYMALIDLPYGAARIVWHLFTVITLLASFVAMRFAFVQALGTIAVRRVEVALGAVLLAVVAGHSAVEFHFCQGQTNIQMLCLIVTAAALSVSNWRWREQAAGAALALAVLSKVFPAIVLPVFLMAGRWRVLAWTAGWTIVFIAATVPLTGINDYIVYPQYFSGTFYFGDGIVKPINLAFKRFWLGWFINATDTRPWLKQVLSAVCATPVAYVFLRTWLERKRALARSATEIGLSAHFLARLFQAAILIGFIMASYWEYHMVTTFGALGMIAALWARERQEWRLPFAMAILSYGLSVIPYSRLEGPEGLGAGGFALVRCTAIVLIALAMEIVARRLSARSLLSATARDLNR